MKVVEQSHRPAVRQEVIDNIIQTSIQQAFAQEGVKPASQPHIDNMSEQGAAFTYRITYDVFPEIAQINLDDIHVAKITAKVEDSDVDNMLTTLREQRATWQPLTRAAEQGDGITIDFVGSIDGKAFNGGKGTDVLVVIGDGTMLPAFENGLIGATKGDKKAITMTFPDDYRVEHLRQQQATFAVTVKSVAAKKIPELNDEFATLCDVTGGVAALIKEVRANMTHDLARAIKARNKRNVMDSLAEHHKVALPEVPMQREAERLMQQAKDNLQGQGVSAERISFGVDDFKESARRGLLLRLLMRKIIADNDIKADDHQVKQVIDSIAERYEDSAEVVQFYMNDKQKLSEIKMAVLEDAVVEWVLDRVNVKVVSLTFKEVMRAEKQQRPLKTLEN